MFKKHVLAAGAALALCSTGALADPFTFDPTGTPGAAGNITNIGLFDQAVGNSLAVNGGGTVVGQRGPITVLYQANLAVANDATDGSISFFNGQSVGGSRRYFTFVAGFGEQVVAATGSTAQFAFDTTQSTFFRMYATTAQGDNLAGTGFTSGQLILSGTLTATGFASNYTRSGTGTSLFDQSGNGDQYGGFQSINGAGVTSLQGVINFTDANYFPDLTAGSVLTFFNTSQVTPFNQVDPSRVFTNADGTTRTPNLGTQNGANSVGTDFQLQADGNSSFTRVPEPDSVALLGIGAAMVGFLARRRRRQA